MLFGGRQIRIEEKCPQTSAIRPPTLPRGPRSLRQLHVPPVRSGAETCSRRHRYDRSDYWVSSGGKEARSVSEAEAQEKEKANITDEERGE